MKKFILLTLHINRYIIYLKGKMVENTLLKVYKHMNKAVTIAGITNHATVHTLMHGFATHLLNNLGI